jgi:hypothetical protein
MFEQHRPQIHLYGHCHNNINEIYKETRFICLNELEYIDIEFTNGKFTIQKKD